MSEVVLKKGDKGAMHFTFKHPSDMQHVNDHPGILVAAKTLKRTALKAMDGQVWFTLCWENGLKHLANHHNNRKSLPPGTKFYVCLLFPGNFFYKKLRSAVVAGGLSPALAMAAIVQDFAIGDIWLEVTIEEDGQESIKKLAWKPPAATGYDFFSKMTFTDPPVRTPEPPTTAASGKENSPAKLPARGSRK